MGSRVGRLADPHIHPHSHIMSLTDKLTNEGQEAVETVLVTVNENDKRTSANK
jgi:hypothetical protein